MAALYKQRHWFSHRCRDETRSAEKLEAKRLRPKFPSACTNAWPTDGKLLVPGLNMDEKYDLAMLLATHQVLKATTGPEGVTISVPAAAPDKISSTIVLKISGTPEITQHP